MTSKKNFIILFVLLALAAVLCLSGCSSSTVTPTATTAPTAVPEEPTEAVAAEPAEVEETAEDTETAVEAPAEEAETAPEEAEGAEDTTEEPSETEAAAEDMEAAADESSEAEVPAEDAEENTYVASVDGEGISLDSFTENAVFNRYQYINMYSQYAQMYSAYGLPLDSLNQQMEAIVGESGKERIGSEVIDQLTYNKVLDMEAAEAGLEITDSQVYDQLKVMFGYEDPSDEDDAVLGLDSFNVSPNDVADEDDKNAEFRSYAEMILALQYNGDVTFDFLKDYAKSILIDNTLFEEELNGRVFESEMVTARHILVEDEATAKEIIAKLDAGESWNDLAAEYSLDTANKNNGGDLGWFGRGEMVTEFEEAAFALEPGHISEPVQTAYGFHIIASDGKEMRPMTGTALENAQNALYDEWAIGLRAKHNIENYPEVWMDAVPMEPVFTPISTETEEIAIEEPAVEEEAAETVEQETDEAIVAEAVAAEIVEEAEAEAEAAEEAAETVEQESDEAIVAEAAAAEIVEEAETEAEAAEEAAETVEQEAVEAIVAEAATAEIVEEAEAEAEAVEEAAEIIEQEAVETIVAEAVAAEIVEEAEAEAEAVEEAAAEEPADDAEKASYVATVNGNGITPDAFVKTATFNRYQILDEYNQYAQIYAMFGMPLDDVNAYYESFMGEEGKESLGESVINQLAYYKILDLESEETGITVTDQETVAMMKSMFGYTDGTEEAEASLGMESFNLGADDMVGDTTEDDDFKAYISMNMEMVFGDAIDYDFYHDFIRHNMLENAMLEKAMEDQVFEEEMVNARHILVEDEATANDIIARLENGEDWDALALENSIDTGSAANGGALGWFGRGVMVSEFEDAAFALEPGEMSAPVQSNFGYHIIISDGKEIRPMEGDALTAAQNAFANEWYQRLIEKYDIQSFKEVWLPLVPLEPAFVPVEIDGNESEIPTFVIGGDNEAEDGAVQVAEPVVTVVEEADDEEIAISNTEQDDGVYLLDNAEELNLDTEEDELAIVNTEQEAGLTIVSTEQKVDAAVNNIAETILGKVEEEIGINNTEQIDGAYTINNDAENK